MQQGIPFRESSAGERAERARGAGMTVLVLAAIAGLSLVGLAAAVLLMAAT